MLDLKSGQHICQVNCLEVKTKSCIARAAAEIPKFWYDELTDVSSTSKEVVALIQQINKSGKTILIVTHEDIAMCSRIVRLKDGVMEDKKIK